MKIKLTDRERVTMGWDDPCFLTEIQGTILRDAIRKATRGEDLNEEEVTELREEVALAAEFGADPCHTKSVKGLRRKFKLS